MLAAEAEIVCMVSRSRSFNLSQMNSMRDADTACCAYGVTLNLFVLMIRRTRSRPCMY